MKNQTLNEFPQSLLEKIKNASNFPADFDFNKELVNIRTHLDDHMPDIEQIPSQLHTTKAFKALIEKSRTLLSILQQTMPLILNECDSIYKKVYTRRIYPDLQLSTAYIEHNLQNLKAIYYSLKTQIDKESYEKMVAILDEIQSCFHKADIKIRNIDGDKKTYFRSTDAEVNEIEENKRLYFTTIDITVPGLLNIKIPLEAVTADHTDSFIDSLQHTINILITACEAIIDEINNNTSIVYLRPNRGSKFKMARSNVILMFASIYERATGDTPRAGYYFLTKSYIGDFYEFILECKPLFDLLGVPLPPKESAIGKLLVETLPTYRNLTEQV